MTRPTHLRIHQFAGLQPGPRLLVTSAVHGNEVHGTKAMAEIARQLDAGQLTLRRGTLTFVPIVNPLAHQLDRREGDRNLNRNLRPPVIAQDFEDRIARVLCPLIAQHDGILDLHSFQSAGQAFAMIGPRNNTGELEPFAQEATESALAGRLGVSRIVEGWLSTYALGLQRRQQRQSDGSRRAQLISDPHYGVGTTEYMRSTGGWAITLECGQHLDPNGPEVARLAILRTLVFLGMLDDAAVEPHRPAQPPEVLQLYDVIDREDMGDSFEHAWASFDAIKRGQQIGTRASGEAVLAPSEGRIVFPNVKSQPGTEWFYLARPSDRVLG
ncbi:succinylglutamate desuccinylase/aspartoacylase family protein [Roseateles cellulosilyticus]|uniref:Succinylglutamate desuccinylase/aspartoacylase family protein n=1 Tax=Pelomonas cellulosilytica TaxID=2906762 RepID=A0ABS8XW78_9BURK|nr:succinylglutamate desuccinylase/aspartoacylase family protein [Pelomonas sp. P8]MCE4556042.1 succinylglutamate desuccinylase/aspartoacylase family protein [Pelomonas sp. P8]